MRPLVSIALLLVGAVCAVYLQVRDHDFVDYDDLVHLANASAGLSREGVTTAFTTQTAANWIPVTMLTLLANVELHGNDAAGFLLTNVALHATSAVLLFLALWRMTGSTAASAFVAAIFAVHPLHVESVAWVSQRKDVLCGLFWMLGLHAYVSWVRRPHAARYGVLMLWLVLGLLSKPMMVTFPFVLLLLDYWPLARLRPAPGRRRPDARALRRALLEKLPLLVPVLAAGVVTYRVQDAVQAVSTADVVPLAWRLANAALAYASYLADAVWPRQLAALYPHPMAEAWGMRAAAAGLGLLALTLAAVALARSRPYLLVGWLWYLGTLVPVLGLVQVGMQARADRYTYLPLVGVAIAVAWSARDLARRHRSVTALVAAAGILAVCALGVAARQQVGHWRDSVSLYRRALAVTDGNFVAHRGIASAHRRAGRLDEARAHYAAAARLRPAWAPVQRELAEVLLARGELAEAVSHYERALSLEPSDLRSRINLAHVLLRQGRSEAAREQLFLAREQLTAGAALPAPFRSSLELGLARVLFGSDPEAALVHAQRARALAPRSPAARRLLAQLYIRRGEAEAALRELEQWAVLQPDSPEPQLELGIALLRDGRAERARTALERARERGADSPAFFEASAELAVQDGDGTRAAALYREALDRDPRRLRSANNLAWLLATHPDVPARDPDEALRWAEVAAEATRWGEPSILDTLAAVHAARGDFETARIWAERAASLADDRGDTALARTLRARSADYRAGRAAR